MSRGGLSPARLARMAEVMAGHVDRGAMPGLVSLVSRRGETHVEAIGTMAVGGKTPMARDSIFRIASMSKPITAAAAMILVEECKLRLDDPVDALLPELANRRVLKALDGPVDDTVPARRPITLRDLLTFRMGFGMLLAPPGAYPVQAAIDAAGFAPGPDPSPLTPDQWMKNLGALPLLHQPGESWMYHTGADVLGVLISRATGRSFEAFLAERIFGPLDMKDTGFHVPADKLSRLTVQYRGDPATGTLRVYDDPADSRWGRPPAFQSGGGGLVSTADDYLTFCRMLLDKGLGKHGRILSRPSVELMITDQLTPAQKAGAEMFFGTSAGWGFGMAVVTAREHLASVGRFGWDGGLGATAHSDPAEDMVGILLTPRMMDGPMPPAAFTDFWTGAYQAIDD
jgi:CubicO group peptidase (beta-lactamase class C family)